MLYRNPRAPRPQPEQAGRGENRELFRLLVIVGLLVVISVVTIDRLTAWLAPKLPFALEVGLADSLSFNALVEAEASRVPRDVERRRAVNADLQRRSQKILRVLQAPPDLTITPHYLESDTANAVTTIGGHILLFGGLLDKLRYEEELDAILAHEIGHVLHRHVVQHLSRGVTTAVVIGLLGIRSASLNQWLLGDLRQLEQLAYSRDAEREADETAILASQRLYGGTAGVVSVFDLFNRLQRTSALAWTQSHPLPAERAQHARELDRVGQQPRPLTPLTPPLKLSTQNYRSER